MGDMRAEVKEFLATRRGRLTPEQAGLPVYCVTFGTLAVGGCAGLAPFEGNVLLAGASESVLDSLATALQLDDAERQYLFDLARAAGPAARRKRKSATVVRPAVQQVLDAMADAPAWVRNARHDIIATNTLGRALYSPVFDDPHRPVNTTRFAYLNPAAKEFWRDYDQILHDAASMLRMEAARNPHDPDLIQLVGELSTRSETFRERWASRDVKFHRTGVKRLHHPVVGDLDLNYESMELPGEPGLFLNVYTAPADSPSADALRMLASWAATREGTPTTTQEKTR